MGAYYYSSVPWLIPQVPSEFLRIFYECSNPVSIKKGTYLFGKVQRKKGYDLNAFTYLESGMLCQGYPTGDVNRPTLISLTLPGRAVGYMRYLGSKNHSEYTMALRDSVIRTLPIPTLAGYEKKSEPLRKAIMQYCVECIESDQEGFITMFTRNAEQRMKILLKAILESYIPIPDNSWVKLPIRLTHEEYSKVIYTTGKTVNTMLPEWKKRGWYKTDDREVYIHTSLFDSLENGNPEI